MSHVSSDKSFHKNTYKNFATVDLMILFDESLVSGTYGVRDAIYAVLRDRAPYPWCHQPITCIKRGYCPTNPSCGD